MAFYLGIDGGASKTACLVGDESSVLGRGTAGSSNLVRVGEAKARKSLTEAIGQACAQAGITPAQTARTCVGMAGAARAEISDVARRVVADIVAGEVEIVGDMVVALEAAFGGGPGVVVIAGTGSIAYGANAEAQVARAGGWGFAVSDEGSGYWIGRTAVGAVMRAHDAGENVPLLESIMKLWKVETFEQLVLAANASAPPDFAALFPAVLSAAEANDSSARSVLDRAGGELATLAKVVIRRVFAEGGKVPVAMSGGVFANSAQVRQVFYNSVHSGYPEAAVSDTVAEPVQGALALARKGSTER
jgi:N-acetylglucosamine kinase-like BadF-type ATPase